MESRFTSWFGRFMAPTRPLRPAAPAEEVPPPQLAEFTDGQVLDSRELPLPAGGQRAVARLLIPPPNPIAVGATLFKRLANQLLWAHQLSEINHSRWPVISMVPVVLAVLRYASTSTSAMVANRGDCPG